MSTGLSEAERIARVRLARTDKIGPVTFRQLLDRFGTAERALEAGWPAGCLSVLSESAGTRAEWAARGLHVTARPGRAARDSVPDAWRAAALPGRPDS